MRVDRNIEAERKMNGFVFYYTDAKRPEIILQKSTSLTERGMQLVFSQDNFKNVMSVK